MSIINSMKKTTFDIPSFEKWQQVAEQSLKGKPYEKLVTHTYEGIAIKPIYTEEDMKGISTSQPGSPPYIRGTNVTGYLNGGWNISQKLDIKMPSEFNVQLQKELNRGLNSIYFEIDQQREEGLQIEYLDDLKAALKGIDLSQHPVYIDAQELSTPIYSALFAMLKETETNHQTLHGVIGMDPIGYLAKKGEIKGSLDSYFDHLYYVTKWTIDHSLSLKTIIVHGDFFHNSGANATQELAYSFAVATIYLQELLERGLSINEIAPRICFSFSVGTQLFMEISKLRAAKKLWAQIVRAYGGDEESQKIWIHVNTSSYSKTLFDPYVNMLRTTTEAFSAIVGGINSLHVSSFNEAAQSSTSFSRRIARNTQLILKEESLLDKVVDPAGGSYYVEKLTYDLAETAWKKFQKIDEEGGFLYLLKNGVIQKELEEVRKKRETAVNTRKEQVIGTNVYANVSEKRLQNEQVNESSFSMQSSDISLTISSHIINECIEKMIVGVSISSIYNALQYGEGEVVKPLLTARKTEQFEKLRMNIEEFEEKTGSMIKVLLLNLGPIAKYKPRSDFTRGFFEAGGFKVESSFDTYTIEDAKTFVAKNPIMPVVLCGTDDLYDNMATELVKELKAINPNQIVILAGKPSSTELEDALRKAGLQSFVYLGLDCFEFLSTLQKEMGVGSW